MNDKYRKLKRCADCVRAVTDFKPLVGLVLGSGLGGFADDMDIVASVDYSDIGGFPVSTVPGHKGRFVFGYVSGVPVVAMQGRVHFYEGYDMENVVLPIRLMGILGAKALILTNAAGREFRLFSRRSDAYNRPYIRSCTITAGGFQYR